MLKQTLKTTKISGTQITNVGCICSDGLSTAHMVTIQIEQRNTDSLSSLKIVKVLNKENVTLLISSTLNNSLLDNNYAIETSWTLSITL